MHHNILIPLHRLAPWKATTNSILHYFKTSVPQITFKADWLMCWYVSQTRIQKHTYHNYNNLISTQLSNKMYVCWPYIIGRIAITWPILNTYVRGVLTFKQVFLRGIVDTRIVLPGLLAQYLWEENDTVVWARIKFCDFFRRSTFTLIKSPQQGQIANVLYFLSTIISAHTISFSSNIVQCKW